MGMRKTSRQEVGSRERDCRQLLFNSLPKKLKCSVGQTEAKGITLLTGTVHLCRIFGIQREPWFIDFFPPLPAHNPLKWKRTHLQHIGNYAFQGSIPKSQGHDPSLHHCGTDFRGCRWLYEHWANTFVYGQCRANKGPCCNLGLLTGTNILQRLMQISRCPSDPAVTNLGFFTCLYTGQKKVPHRRGDWYSTAILWMTT